jgi:hypothetical protein
MRILDLYMRVIHASKRRSTASTRFIKRGLLKIIRMDLSKQIEFNYVNLNQFKSKVTQISPYSAGITLKLSTESGPYSHTFSGRFSIEIENVLVDSENNFIYIDKGNNYLLLNESTEWPVESILSTTKFPKLKDYQEIEFGSLGLPNTGFYHWVSEDLPNFLNLNSSYPYLNYVKASKMNNIILNQTYRNFLQVPKYIYVKKLIFNSKGKDLGKIPLDNIDSLRKFSNSLGANLTKKDEIFYISRSNSRRSLKNEIQLEQLFKKLEISVVNAEEIDLLDQIRLFSNAKLIIGAHGAGLVHGIWANDCALFEIVDDQPINRCFEWQTLVQNNVYRRFKVAKEPNYPLLVRQIYDAIQRL